MGLSFRHQREIYNVLHAVLIPMPGNMVRYNPDAEVTWREPGHPAVKEKPGVRTDAALALYLSEKLGTRVPASTVSRIRRDEFGEVRASPTPKTPDPPDPEAEELGVCSKEEWEHTLERLFQLEFAHATMREDLGDLLAWASDPTIQRAPHKTITQRIGELMIPNGAAPKPE